MAKTTTSRTRRSGSASHSDSEQEPVKSETAATAVVEPAPAPAPIKTETPAPSTATAGGGDDVASLDAETNAKYEQVKGGKLYIKDLQMMDVHKLHDIAKEEGIQDYIGLKKQDLIFQILRARIRQNGLMYGEGVLEILPDGFGFLRSPEYNYLTSAPARFAASACATGTSCKARSARPKKANVTSHFFALRRSTAKTPSALPIPAISKT